MTACEYQFGTYVDYESIPAFLAYLGSYYQNANTEASCRINVLANRWPESLIEQLSLHEKLNLVISDNSALQYTQRSKIDLLVDYLRWLDSILQEHNLPIISHYAQGLFLKPLNIRKEHQEFDVLVAGPRNSRFEKSLGELLINSLANFTMIFTNRVAVKSIICFLEKSDTVEDESEKYPIVPPIALGFVSDHGELHRDANCSDVLAFIWQDPKIRSTNHHFGNCARRWFNSEAEDALLVAGNYADPLLLEEWLIDSISATKYRPA